MKASSLILAVIVIVSTAAADPIVQKQLFSGTSGFSQTVSFDKFNLTGSLTSVEITFNLQITGGSLILDNDSDSNICGTLEFGSLGSISSSEVNLPASSLTNHVFYSQPFSLDANDLNDNKAYYDPTPPDGMQYNGDNKSGNVQGLVDTMVWDTYIGTGKYDITVSILPWIDCGNFDNLQYCVVTPINTNGYIEVVYNYIPEPTTITLLAISALSFLTRKNRYTEQSVP
ncbi:MAG: hypothetical protein A2173_04965 [Planctomycetes bacterium RBG_13_44_8b]|nr:MAG: hypothetical protein A2173_04965 [Planctomycetes bacterium RBG_13_44_8b]